MTSRLLRLGRAASIATLALCAPATTRAQSASSGEIGRRIEASLDSLAASDWLSGAVLVMRGRDTLVARAYGMADHASQRSNAIDTRFAIASASKMLTAIAVAQLAERGRLRLSDTVGRFLPEYPNATVRSRVTVAHLLSHTSGMGSYWNARYAERRSSMQSGADYVALTAGDSLLFAPGLRYEYSNAGYALLGGIIERAGGMRYADYVARHILQPVGMRRTGYPLLLDPRSDVAVGYGAASPGPMGPMGPMRRDRFAGAAPATRPNTDALPSRGGAAGDAASTVGDLAAFLRAVGAGRLTSAAMRDTLWTIRARPEGPTGRGQAPYGYGFVVRDTPLGRAVGHPGGSVGRGALAQYYPERDVTIVILVNVDPMITFEALRRIETHLVTLPR
ncbi:MAG: serine hydrolase domain-containing protein [Gemmatirosa sp.]